MGRKLIEPFEHGAGDFVEEMDDDQDPRMTYARLQSRINEYRAAGWKVPDELTRIERRLMTDFMAESQGR